MQRILIFFTVLLAVASLSGQTVEVWTTGGVTSERLQRWNDVTFTGDGISNASTITVQPWKKYQAIDGFGYTLTQGSAKVLRGLKDWKRKQVLRDLFGPDGIGLSVVRIGIGATDLSESAYTYNDQGPDPQLNGFSLAGPDLRDLVPVLREIVAINPQIKVLATPWTAPKWMKTNNSYRGGNLKPQYMEVYATYFLRYLEAMKAQGISIWAITPQNEPGHGGNVPSMEMSEAQQLAFVDRYLGPKLAASRFDPLIIGYDHNCDEPSIPINLLNGSDYFDGAAFHLYAGNIGAMSQVHAATGKGVYFTEQYTGAAGSFNGDFGWHMENIVIGSLNNWSRTVLEWNLAADATQGPHTSGGCTDCLPALTISGGNATPNVAYYIIAQIAKFVPPGSVRLGATSRSGNLLTTAFQRPDGKRVVLVYNRSSNSSTVRIKDGGRSFDQYIHGRSAITFVWNSGGPALRQIASQAETAAQGVYIFPNPADSELRAELDPDAGYDRLWL
ncbi:MAG: glycoside hydrolase family 30 beta sandwich domain-containing protein, partial [Lewinella sp.]